MNELERIRHNDKLAKKQEIPPFTIRIEYGSKRAEYELAKKRLEALIEEAKANFKIESVQTKGGFLEMFDHKVTGEELNKRLIAIQEHFNYIIGKHGNVIEEFLELYKQFDERDKNYIERILRNVILTVKTSNDVKRQQKTLKQHNDKLARQQSKLDAHQIEIEKNVANISKIVTALKIFKEKLEGYKHLTDIDKIWNDCQTIQNEIRVVSDSITKLSQRVTEDIAVANNQNKDLKEEIEAKMAVAIQETNNTIESLTKKIKYAYWIAGGAAGLAIIELILFLL